MLQGSLYCPSYALDFRASNSRNYLAGYLSNYLLKNESHSLVQIKCRPGCYSFANVMQKSL
jgi:hypothetical protein